MSFGDENGVRRIDGRAHRHVIDTTAARLGRCELFAVAGAVASRGEIEPGGGIVSLPLTCLAPVPDLLTRAIVEDGRDIIAGTIRRKSSSDNRIPCSVNIDPSGDVPPTPLNRLPHCCSPDGIKRKVKISRFCRGSAVMVIRIPPLLSRAKPTISEPRTSLD